MTEESWNLSDRINFGNDFAEKPEWFHQEDVQEFIRRLKEEYQTETEWSFIRFINKLAGSKLNKQGGKKT